MFLRGMEGLVGGGSEGCPVFFMTPGRAGDPVKNMTQSVAVYTGWGDGECEQSVLSVVGLLFAFLARPKKVNRKKRVRRGRCPLVDPPLAVAITCGIKIGRTVLPLCSRSFVLQGKCVALRV